MPMTVSDRAKAIGMFRWIEVRLMELAAAWTPTTPEMEVKVMFGRHIFDFAQHADALGKRTFELRQPMHYTVRPDDVAAVIDREAAAVATAERIDALYDKLLPLVEKRYREYLADTDPILDEPSIIIIERILQDVARHRGDARNVRAEVAA